MKFFRFTYYLEVLLSLTRNTSGLKPLIINGPKLVFEWQSLANILAIKEVVIDQDYFNLLPDRFSPKIVVDIGSGIGDFALLAAKKWPRANIMGFEMNTKQFEIAIKNRLLNKIDSVDFVNKQVRNVRDLFTVLKSHAKIDLLKIDCEGGEFYILKDAKPETIAYIVGEYHESGSSTINSLVKILQGAGYVCSVTPNRGVGGIGFFSARGF